MTCKYKYPDSNNIDRCFLYDGTEEYLPTLEPLECNAPDTKKCDAYAEGEGLNSLEQLSAETLSCPRSKWPALVRTRLRSGATR
ncbi:MAG: hypothetical protein A4E48_02258 [Methanosaeta sp. PtaU1.Bin060]|nr:MAG: hypothetical protein A4E48_02258 [Methanosaeta sp. PtaU1.Bin060]